MICVDPGVRACGVALFRDRELVEARYVPVEKLATFLRGVVLPLVIEMPRIYPHSGQQKGDLNDLLNLAAVVGYVEGLMADSNHERVAPGSWKGQVPKPIMTKRILSKLGRDELGQIVRVGAKDHNIVDAIGIGLWKLGRL